MHARPPDGPQGRRRARDDDGAALIEFTLISVLLFTLVFGIISFGLLLSFKQDMTRAAAEGARGGAVAFPATDALADASDATDEALNGFGQACGDDGMACEVELHDCDDSAPDLTNDPTKADCVSVTLRHDYGSSPIVPSLPVVSAFMPDELVATSVARVNS
ncbi:MAG: pilus assembly protein [Acidimicrobiales bacterium]|nr:pilus assembly protein [Acidimicrobiales bacterium]